MTRALRSASSEVTMPVLTMSTRRLALGSLALGSLALGRLGLAVLASGAVGCNSVLDIDEAGLTCAPGDCDAGALAEPRASFGAPSVQGDEVARGAGQLGSTSSPAREPANAAPRSPAGASATSSETAGSPPIALGDGGVVPVASPPSTTSSAGETPVGEASPPAGGPPTAEPPALPLGPPLDANGLAVALPNDLIDAPVGGEIIFSEEAEWEVEGGFRPAFEVKTPTASYWIVKNMGTMVSMENANGGPQWIAFSIGFRPLRNIPAFEAPPAAVTTVLDRESQTPTHLRLTSDSSDGAWHWVWDFYVTHATFTIDRAPGPIGFAYRGVPAGTLGAEDQLIQGDGTAQGARNSFNGELPGPVEWVYFADTAARRSLFLMQHTDDNLVESYQVRDNDSASWVFGSGQITGLPIRFSLGLLDTVDPAAVAQRVAYVAQAIH